MNSTTTKRQRAAVHFCEQWLNITFEGNIEDKYQVSIFLGEYLKHRLFSNEYSDIPAGVTAFTFN